MPLMYGRISGIVLSEGRLVNCARWHVERYFGKKALEKCEESSVEIISDGYTNVDNLRGHPTAWCTHLCTG